MPRSSSRWGSSGGRPCVVARPRRRSVICVSVDSAAPTPPTSIAIAALAVCALVLFVFERAQGGDGRPLLDDLEELLHEEAAAAAAAAATAATLCRRRQGGCAIFRHVSAWLVGASPLGTTPWLGRRVIAFSRRRGAFARGYRRRRVAVPAPIGLVGSLLLLLRRPRVLEDGFDLLHPRVKRGLGLPQERERDRGVERTHGEPRGGLGRLQRPHK